MGEEKEMDKNNKVIITILATIVLVGAWYVYQVMTAKPVDPNTMDGRKAAQEYIEKRKEYYQKKGELAEQCKKEMEAWKVGLPVPESCNEEVKLMKKKGLVSEEGTKLHAEVGDSDTKTISKPITRGEDGRPNPPVITGTKFSDDQKHNPTTNQQNATFHTGTFKRSDGSPIQ